MVRQSVGWSVSQAGGQAVRWLGSQAGAQAGSQVISQSDRFPKKKGGEGGKKKYLHTNIPTNTKNPAHKRKTHTHNNTPQHTTTQHNTH